MRRPMLALSALCFAVALLGCAAGDDSDEGVAELYVGPAPVTVTTDMGDGVQASWKAPRDCREVAELRDFLATATPGPLVDLMRSGTEQAAADLGCDKL